MVGVERAPWPTCRALSTVGYRTVLKDRQLCPPYLLRPKRLTGACRGRGLVWLKADGNSRRAQVTRAWSLRPRRPRSNPLILDQALASTDVRMLGMADDRH